MRRRELAEWAHTHGLEVAPTLVPQLFVALHAEPNRTVWTAFLQRLLHATGGPLPTLQRPEGWEPSRGAGEVFALQARGTKPYGNGVKHWVWTDTGGVDEQ